MALICGLLVAGGVHAARATARPLVTASTGGVGNPVVSLLEDVVSAVTAIMSILVPALVAVVVLLPLVLFVWWFARRRRRQPRET